MNFKIKHMRWVVDLFLFLGLFCNYMLRIHIDFAIVQMVGNGTNTEYQQLDWTPKEKSWVLGSFFYGYILLQIPGGRFAERYGSRIVLGGSMLGSICVTLLIPVLATLSPWAVVTARVVQGLFVSPSFPSLTPFTVKWSPINERAKFISISGSGAMLGPVLVFPLCGLIMDNLGWQMVFYTTACISLLWCIIWFIFVTDAPETNRWITKAEVDYIVSGRELPSTLEAKNTDDGLVEPSLLQLFFKMITNRGLWMVMLCDFAFNWGLYCFLVMGPTFIQYIFEAESEDSQYTQSALLTMLPFLAELVSCQVCGFLADFMVSKGVDRLKVQKLFVSLEMLPPAAAMIAMGFLTFNPLLCVIVISVGFFFSGASASGQVQNLILMTPNRAGTGLGISNGFGNLAGAITPLLANLLTAGDLDIDTLTGWRIYFATATLFYVVAWIGFFFFAADKQQPFDTYMVQNKKTQRLKKKEAKEMA